MIRKLSFLLLCGLLLLGCNKINDRIDRLTDRVDNLENTTLPRVDQQIESIRQTLPQLQQADSELKDYIITLQDKVNTLTQSLTEVNTKIDDLQQDVQADLADITTQLNNYKQEVQGKIDALNAQIESLQAADKSLEQKIASLEGDLDAQRDWVTTTFTTLEQYNGLVEDIASIEASIETINGSISDLETRVNEKIATDIASAVAGMEEKLQNKVTEITDGYTKAIATAREEITAAYTSAISSAIDGCVSEMKSWVNEELANYYDIATVDAKLQLLQEAITSGDAASDEKLTSEIAAVNKSIETAKSELTEAYQTAIATAIETNNGVIDSKIAQQIQNVNSRIDSEVQTLTGRLDAIEQRLSELEGKVDGMADEIAALLKRIQSVTYVPQYDDGKIEVLRVEGQDNGIAEMDFLISPKEVVTDLEKVWEEAVSVKAVHTKTRAVDFIEMPVLDFAADAETGVITVKASGENLGEEFFAGTQSASAALFISDSNSNVTSEYIPMLLNNDNPVNVYRTGWAELPVEHDADGNSIDDNNASLYYAHHLCPDFRVDGHLARNYTVCFSGEHHCPVWVAAPRHDCYEGTADRTNAYKSDPDIPSDLQYYSKDTGGGCNKGHMLGSAERTCTSAVNQQVFYYTNIAPQYSTTFNTGGGAWNNLEYYIDRSVCADTLYTVIGCYFDKFSDKRGNTAQPSTISFGGRNDVSCPTMFYYALLRTKNGRSGKNVRDCSASELQCVAFVKCHTAPKGSSVSSEDMISISELEELTGFTYFPNVPNAPKDTYSPSDWGL